MILPCPKLPVPGLMNKQNIKIMNAAPIIGIIGFFVTMIITVILFFRTRHRERLALIKYDKDARVFKSESRIGLKLGLILLSLGAGLGVGSFIDAVFRSDSPIGVFTCMMLFGGAALIYYHLIFNEKGKQDMDDLV